MVLEVKNLEFSYDGKPVLKGVNFSVDRGDFVSILGVNGAGKSTLLKCINGILKPKRGKILVNNMEINKLSQEEIAKIIAYVPQRAEQSHLIVFDGILLGRKPHIKFDVTKRDLEITKNIIEMLNLEEFSLRYMTELSGGELQKVVIGRALAQEPLIMLLDEPTNNLDLKNQIEVMSLIKKICKEQNIAVLTVMHDINLALRFSDKFILLKDGRVYAMGGLEVITSENIEKVFGVSNIIEKVRGKPVMIIMD
ncbi:MAG: iron ABC transporter ATP-binding protein [Dictyoglomus sp. NZ13-RE01]|nr:MAG: iron ABC transporter ATP-binding protein [Dictyoglomus sp. NZ13-RE01]